MAQRTRATVYFDPGVYRAVKVQAALNNQRISSVVNDAVREALRAKARRIADARRLRKSRVGHSNTRRAMAAREDAIDREALRQRRHEPRIPLEQVLADLKRRGVL